MRVFPSHHATFAIIAKNATFFDGAEAWFDCNYLENSRFAANMHIVNVPENKKKHVSK